MRHILTSLLIGGFGAMAIVVGVLMAIQRVRLLRTGVRATGTIVDEVVSSSHTGSHGPRRGQPARSPVIEVVDAATGQPFRFNSSFGTNKTVVLVGDTVPVRYLAGQHDQAEIDRLLPMWGLPVAATGIGAVLLTAWWYL